VTGTATVGVDGTAVIAVPVAADSLTEGAETLTVTAGGQTASVTVNDTSTTPAPVVAPVATYAIAASSTSVNEGSAVNFTLSTTNVPAGSLLAYTLGGTISAADVVGGALTGTVTVGFDGKAILPVTLSADALTEGAETITVSIATATSAAVTVNDTSLTPAPAALSPRLTTSAETLTGGLANDTFDASLNGTAQTLSAQDSISGGGGVDTINASLTGAQTLRPTLVNIANVNITSAGNATVDMTNSTGYVSLQNIGSAGNLVFDRIADATDTLRVTSPGGNTTFTFTDASLAGPSDVVPLVLDAASGTITISDAGGSNNVETLAITASNGNTTLTALTTGTTGAGVNVTNITVAGNANLNLGSAISASVSNFDASRATGNVTAVMGAVANATVQGGAGNDTFTVDNVSGIVSVMAGAGNDTIIAASNLTATDTINGGDGTADALSTVMATVTTLTGSTPATYNITNIEQLTVTDEFDGTNVVLSNLATGINTLNLARLNNTLASGSNDTVVGAAGSFTINLGAQASDNTNPNGILTGSLGVRATGAAATDTLTINDTQTNSGLNVNVFNGQNITNVGYENVVISSGTIVGGALATIGTLANSGDASASPASLTVTGANPFQATSVTTNSTGLYTINASGLTAQNAGTTTFRINGTTSGTGGTQSITGSAGEDIITTGNFASTIIGGAGNDNLTGGTAADSIDGGAGDDTIAGGNGNNTLIGGLGADRITLGTGADSVDAGAGNDTIIAAGNLTSADSINGGDGTDIISVTGGSSVSSASFTNVTNVETIAFTGTGVTSLAAPLIAGLSTFDLSDTAAQQLTFGNGFTGSATVLESNGSASNAGAQDVITNTANIALTVRGIGAAMTTVQVVGGTGVDTLQITADSTTVSLVNTSAIDNVTMVAGTNAASTAVISNAVIASGRTLTVDASAMTDSAATFGFSAGGAQAGGVNLTGATNAVNTIDLTNFAGANTVNGGAGADTITAGSGNDSLAGGAGGDAYVFASGTLNNLDTVTDSAGTDVLRATINGLTSTTGALNITGVETINLNTATAASTVNAAGITGVTRINVADAQNVTLTGLRTGVTLGLGTSATAGAGATSTRTGTLTFSLGDSTPTNDSVTVSLSNTTNDGDVNATLVAAAGIETVSITASTTNASTLNINGLVVPTINVTGGIVTKTLTLNGATLNAATTSFNSSSSSGAVLVSGSDTATTFQVNGGSTTAAPAGLGNNVVGGAGADTITVTNVGTNGTAQTINGGAGNDTLNMTLVQATATLGSVSNVENINLTLTNNIVTTIATVTGFNDANYASTVVTGGTSLSGLTVSGAIGSGGAFRSFDASAVSGTVDLIVAPGALALNQTIRAGSGTSDVLRTTAAGATSTAATIAGFESMVITTSTNDNGSQALTNATGLTSVTVMGTNSYALTGLAAGVAVNVGTTGTALTDAKFVTATLALNTGTADALTFNLVNTTGVTGTRLTADGVETITLNESSTAAASAMGLLISDSNTNPVNINLTNGIAAQTITFLQSGLQTNVSTLNASSFLGNMVMADNSRLGSTSMTITGGAGNDTIIMRAGSDVLDGGANGTSAFDTLKIVQNATLGGFQVDLSSTVDQVGTYNGSANAAIQRNFENVDLSGVTGTFGSDITARAAGSTIVGSINNDVITGGAGNDVITGGTGADTISVGTGTDNVKILAADISATNGGAAAATFAAVGDIISGLTNGDGTGTSDSISLSVSGFTGADIPNRNIATASNLAAANAIIQTGGAIKFHNAAIGNAGTNAVVGGVIQSAFVTAALGVITTAGAGTDSATTSDVYVLIRDQAGDGTADIAIFKVDHAAGNANITAAEVTFLGVITDFGTTMTTGFIVA